MHLIILTQYYPPEIGAPQARLSAIARHFVQRGHLVTVLTGMPNYPQGKIFPGYGGFIRRETYEGVEVIRTFIYPTQKADFFHRLLNYFSFVFSSGILGAIVLPKADFLLIESPPLFLGLSGLWLSWKKRVRLIFNVSDLWPESAVRVRVLEKSSLAYKISAMLEKSCYEHAWLITGQSKGILTDIQFRFPGCPTFHLSNGVDIDMFHPNKKTQEACESLHNDKGDCVVLYAGLHGLAQGLEQAIDAANLLRKDDSLKFVFIGDGPQKNTLIERAKKYNLSNISFMDPRPAQQIPSLLACADIILVMLKMYIPGAVPSKLYEAMASGRPVMLVASGEAAEIVHEYQAGMVVAPGDILGLENALQTLSSRPDLRERYGENGRRAATQYFNRTIIVPRFIDYLEANL